MTRTFKRTPLCLALVGLGTMGSMQVSGQTGVAEGSRKIEEVVVTASKRGATSLQDTAVSASVFSGSKLDEAANFDFADFFDQVPGLTMSDKGPGDKQIVIRGITSNGAGTVALYFDEAIVTGQGEGDFGRAPDIKAFDLERLEVLKGPQGTTFGSNALSGAIRYIPNYPELDVLEGEVGAATSSRRYSDDMGWRLNGTINLPLSDSMAIRLSGMGEFAPGYIDNRFDDDIAGDRVDAARAMFRWDVTDNLDVSAFAMFQEREVDGRHYYHETEHSLNLSDSLNGEPLPQYYQGVLANVGGESDIDIYNIKGNYTTNWGTFTATTSLYERNSFFKRATSAATEVLFGIPADQGGQAYIGTDKDQSIWSNEIRFASNWQGPLQFLGGAMYRDEDVESDSPFIYEMDPVTGRETPDAEVGRMEYYESDVEEYAVFGEVEYSVTDRLRLTAGIRAFDIDIVESTDSIIQFLGQPGDGPGPVLQFAEKDEIYKFNVAYDITMDAMTYFTFSQGYRPGGANDQSPENIPGVNVDIPAGFGSDSLDSWELGFKTAWLDGSLVLNGAFYYIDWTDIQSEARVESEEGLSFAIRSNGGAAEVKGFELSGSWYITEQFSLLGGFNYSEAELTDSFPDASDGLAGDDIPYNPELTGYLTAQYDYTLPNDISGYAAADWTYQDETYNRYRDNDPEMRTLDAYSVLDLRVGFTRDQWELILRLNNALDADEVIAYTFDFGVAPGAMQPGEFLADGLVRVQPRTAEVAVRYRF